MPLRVRNHSARSACSWGMLGIALMAMNLMACRTTKSPSSRPASSPASSATQSPVSTPKSQVAPATAAQSLGSELQRFVTDVIQQTSLRQGVEPDTQRMHRGRGLVHCHQDGILQTCYLRVMLPGTGLSDETLIPRKHSGTLYNYLHDARPDLAKDQVMFADLTCFTLGPKSPPFGESSTRCELTQPRASNEVVWSAAAAQMLGLLLKGDQPHTAATAQLNGAIQCLWGPSRRTSQCVVRRSKVKDDSSDLIEMSSRWSQSIGRDLMEGLAQHHRVHDPNGPAFEPPRDLLVNVHCIAAHDHQPGNAKYLCRARL